MKRIITLILMTLVLTGCGGIVSEKEINTAFEACKPYSGLYIVEIKPFGSKRAYCNDRRANSILIN